MSVDESPLPPPPSADQWSRPADGAHSKLDWRYSQPEYIVRRRFFELFAAAVDITAADGSYVMFCKQKAFRLREDIRIFSDPQSSTEIMSIRARQILDFSAAYDVTDTLTGEWVGSIRRKGWQSLLRDLWEVLDPQGNVIATIQEDNLALALVRRFLTALVPQHYDVADPGGALVAEGDQFFNPFLYKLRLRVHRAGRAGSVDPRLILSAALLLAVIEGRQQD
jgi:hypothetical protein